MPVQKTKTETYTETFELETEADRKAAKQLAEGIMQKERLAAQKQQMIDALAAQLEQAKREHHEAVVDCAKHSAQLEAYHNKPKTQTVTKTRDV